MTSPNVRVVARLLSRPDRSGPPPSAHARARGISTVEMALAARGRRHGQRRWAIRLAAAAALAGAVALLALVWSGRGHEGAATPEEHVAVVAHPEGSGVLMVGRGEGGPLPDGRALSAGSRLRTTEHGTAVLALSTGTSMTIGERTDFAVEASGAMQRFNLRAGSVRAEVAKLHEGERFVIRTPDAEVEVRGTELVVEVRPAEKACADGTRTRVHVTRGVVVVRGPSGAASVVAGETWPHVCVRAAPTVAAEPEPEPEPGAANAPSSPPHPSLPVRSQSSAPSELAPVPAASSLAEQNDAFAAAMAAARRGDRNAALAAFDDFLARFPTSPLAESAAVERERLLLDPAP